MRYVRNEYDAEALTNESFMRAFGKIVSFSSNDSGERFDKSFRAWLARIAVNISIDFLRAQKQFVALDKVSEGGFEQQHVEVTGNLHVEDIMTLLLQLPEIQRTRSEESRVGKESVSTSTSRWWPYNSKKKTR